MTSLWLDLPLCAFAVSRAVGVSGVRHLAGGGGLKTRSFFKKILWDGIWRWKNHLQINVASEQVS